MSEHDVALEILIASRKKYLQSAISLLRKARTNKKNAELIIKHANDFHRARARNLLRSIKILKSAQKENCACCMNTGILKGTNEYETDIVCPVCYWKK